MTLVMLTPALFLAANHLLAPTPEADMRELSTDRPDLTEGPYTVDAGHVQVEADLGVVSVEGNDIGVGAFGVNVRVGLTDAVDVHVIAPVLGATFTPTGVKAEPGDLTLRAKWNLLGNDGADVAVALMPYAVVGPALDATGGLIVPFNIALPAEFGLGAMVGAELVREKAAVDADLLVSASVAREIVGGVGAYLEGLAHAQVFSGAHEVWASAGTTWGVTKDIQLDAGARARVLGDAPRAECFVGVTVRR